MKKDPIIPSSHVNPNAGRRWGEQAFSNRLCRLLHRHT
jgi:hypothetical protein